MKYTVHPISDDLPYRLGSDIQLKQNDMLDIVLPNETISIVVTEINIAEYRSYCDYCWLGEFHRCQEIKWLKGNAALCQIAPHTCVFMKPSKIMEEL